ncbi:ExeA family protein [Streptomyces sp. NPDC002285]
MTFRNRAAESPSGVPEPHRSTLISQAADALATEHAERGRVPVLVIDEAHLLDHEQLEAVRMLTNHDTDSTSPLTCLLVGQPTLRRNIKLGMLAALDQRIAIRYNMPPTTGEETTSYLAHHLALAGRSDTLFSDDAITLIHDTARGCPRAVNNLAVQALLSAYADNKSSSTNPPPAPPSPKSPRNDHTVTTKCSTCSSRVATPCSS